MARLAALFAPAWRRIVALWNRDRNGKATVAIGGMFAVIALAALVMPKEEQSTPGHAPGVGATQRAVREEATDAPRPTRTERARATVEPTATDVPPTEAPTDEPEPTIELPTEAPPAAIQPLVAQPQAESGPPHPEWTGDGDRNCDDFAGHRDAQAWWDYWHARGVDNPGGLDGNDNDDNVCESD